MKLIGVTRFNLVTQRTLGSFRSTKGKTLEEAKALIFQPDSLKKRMELFEAFCLSSYRSMAANNPDIFGLVLINEDLPEPFKSDLMRICADVERVRVVEVSDADGVNEAVNPLVHEIAGDGRVYTFRYDDDDALPWDYADRVQEIANGVEVNTVISFNNGYSISRMGVDEYGFYVRKYPLNAFGLGIVSDIACLKTVFELGPHTKITLPVHHDKETIGYACTVHETNDSRVGEMNAKIVSGSEVIKTMRKLFPHIGERDLKILTYRRKSDYEAS